MTEHGSALWGKDKYTKPQVHDLGSIRDLTSANKLTSGSADLWQMYQPDGSVPGIAPKPH